MEDLVVGIKRAVTAGSIAHALGHFKETTKPWAQKFPSDKEALLYLIIVQGGPRRIGLVV